MTQPRIQRALIAAITMLATACAGGAPPQAVPTTVVSNNAERTIWEGVYTEEQRRRGEAVYDSSCVRCHGSELAGTEIVPDLAGEQFLSRWNRGTAAELFELMRTSMPPKRKARLTPPEYADVLAYVLSRNQAPVGQEELASNFAALHTIRMARSN